jgi:uncharacterized protein (TIGR03435 family)
MRFEETVTVHSFSTLSRTLAILTVSMSAMTAAPAQSIVGIWQGTLPAGESPRVVIKIADAEKGVLRGSISFIDRSADAYPLLSTIYNAPELSVAIGQFSFRGKLRTDGKSIAGVWTDGDKSYPLTFALASPETLWTYSGPTTMPAMSATADPAFEVATIKPGPPDGKTWSYSWKTRLFQARNNTVADLIRFAYQVRRRQIDGGPSWMNELRFDVSGEPDSPGLPSFDQQRLMLKKLLAERFDLKLHIEKREFPVYTLVVVKNPPKVNASGPGSGSQMSFSPRELEDGNTAMQFSNTAMSEFADLLMNFIQDRHIVDKTGLSGRFNFTFKIPTSSLRGGVGQDDSDKASAFLVGIQSMGFKLVPKRELLDVIVVDHLDHPTAN